MYCKNSYCSAEKVMIKSPVNFLSLNKILLYVIKIFSPKIDCAVRCNAYYLYKSSLL